MQRDHRSASASITFLNASVHPVLSGIATCVPNAIDFAIQTEFLVAFTEDSQASCFSCYPAS
jgi:hypothetical protein